MDKTDQNGILFFKISARVICMDSKSHFFNKDFKILWK